jgi:NADH-quinone oxidoreductase subunit H
MSSLLSGLFVLLGSLACSYGMAVVESFVVFGFRQIGPALLLPFVEGLTLLRQQNIKPARADDFLFRSAPFLMVAVVALDPLVLPFGPGLIGFDPAIGLFYFLVLLSPFVVAMMNAGWSQNGKEGLFGTFRAAVYLISYEVPIGFAAIGPVMAAQSLSTQRIVESQAHLWYVVWQPLGLVIYLLAAALIIAFHYPFDSALGGDELEGGVFSAYSGARLLLCKIALHTMFFMLMAMGVALFFGGWQGPWLPGPVWFLLKTVILAGLVSWGSRFFPRLRHDQILALAWKVLLPASLLNITLVGILVLIIPGGS